MGGDGSGLVIGDVRQVQTEDADESWERETGEPDVRGVGADRIDDFTQTGLRSHLTSKCGGTCATGGTVGARTKRGAKIVDR